MKRLILVIVAIIPIAAVFYYLQTDEVIPVNPCTLAPVPAEPLKLNELYSADICPDAAKLPFVKGSDVTDKSTLVFAANKLVNNKAHIPGVTFTSYLKTTGSQPKPIATDFLHMADDAPDRWTGCYHQKTKSAKGYDVYWRLILTGVHKDYTRFVYNLSREDYPPHHAVKYSLSKDSGLPPPPICYPHHVPLDPEVGSGTAMGSMVTG